MEKDRENTAGAGNRLPTQAKNLVKSQATGQEKRSLGWLPPDDPGFKLGCDQKKRSRSWLPPETLTYQLGQCLATRPEPVKPQTSDWW